MTLKYSLDENDYLQHQLYIASITHRIMYQRRKSWIILSVTFFLISILFFQEGDAILMYTFMIVGILSFIFYPSYQRNFQERHYRKFVADTYRKRFGEMTTMSFNEKTVDVLDITGEARINSSQIEEINETGNHIYLRLRTGGSLIIPKQQLDDAIQLREHLLLYADKLQIKYKGDLEWKWK